MARRHRSASLKPGKPQAELELTIGMIGARGDGVAVAGDDRVFVPLTVAGDRVRVSLGPSSGEGRRGEVTAWLEQSSRRVAPVCPHFGVCGGCTLQHLPEPDYLAWKREQVNVALGRAGLSGEAAPIIATTPPGGRRRVSFSVSRRGKAIVAGFSCRLSHRLVDVLECPVLAPHLVALLPVLRRSLIDVLADGEKAEAVASLLDGGIDLLLIGPSKLDLTARLALAALAEAADLGRLSWQPESKTAPEPVAARRPVWAWLGGVAVAVPPGGFLQASLEGQAALIDAVLAGVGPGPGVVGDLFAGSGTFSLPLAQAGWRVHAVDGNAPALAALARVATGLPGALAGSATGVTTEGRNLDARPLTALELGRFSAVVFDPPRAGAVAQAAELAASTVAVVVAVSCNPATFARDARVLSGGGYRLVSVLAVDQFLWSAHVELVAVFRRD